MPKENLTPEKPSVEKLKAEVEALKKAPQPEAAPETPDASETPEISETPGISKRRIPDIEKLNLASKVSKPFASGSNKMSWIAAGIVICMLLGVTVGYFVMKPLWAPPVEEPPAGSVPVGPVQPKTVTMHGVIRSLETSIYMQGTHQLVGEDGKVVALLEPGDKIQDLTFLEGSEVDVEGIASKTTEGDMTIIEVEKVRF